MKAWPLPLCQEKTQPDKLRGPDGSWGLVLPTAAAREWKEEKEKKKKIIPTSEEEIPARKGQAGRWGQTRW